jgi:hypothetical protein
MTPRLAHVRVFLNLIVRQESTAIPPSDTDEVKILRGLFYVHLYGAFEKCINEAVEQYRLAINGICVHRSHLEMNFYPVALDPWMTGLRDSGKIQKRIELIKAANASEFCSVGNSVFSDQLQNVWARTLVELADAIGASSVYLRDRRDEHYLDEVVDKRNQVAHGRVDALAVGSIGRASDLAVRLDAVMRVLESFVQMLEVHANTLAFIRPSRRADYSI